MAELVPMTLAAGELKQFRKAGSYFEIVSAPYGLSGVNFYSDQGGQTDSLVNVPAGLFLRLQFGAFDIKNGAVPQNVAVLVLDAGEDGGNRGSGYVRVIDQGADKSLAQSQFVRSITPTAQAALCSYGVVKPGAKSLAIKSMAVASSIAGTIQIGYGLGDGTIISGGAGYTGVLKNKLVNGADSTAQTAAGTAASAVPTGAEAPGYVQFGTYYVPANQQIAIPLSAPIILQAGSAARFYVNGNALNRDVGIWLDAEEF